MRKTLIVLASVGFVLMLMSPAQATSLHTWVSGLGSDSNAGTQTSPYATFAMAVANTSPGGQVTALDGGDFGPVTINQAITINGAPGVSTITYTGGEGIYISDASTTDTIILRNLDIDGLGGRGTDAIYMGGGGVLVVENCSLHGFSTYGIAVGSESSQNVIVKNTTITGGTVGVRTLQAVADSGFNDVVTIRDCVISNASQAGIFNRCGMLDVSNSIITHNYVGVENDNIANGTFISAESNMVTYNTTGFEVYTGAKQRLSNNDCYDNVTGIELAGGTVISDGNNRHGGNASSDNPNAVLGVY